MLLNIEYLLLSIILLYHLVFNSFARNITQTTDIISFNIFFLKTILRCADISINQ